MHAATSERCCGAEFCSAAFQGRGILGDFLRGMAEQDNRPVFDKPGADAGAFWSAARRSRLRLAL
ncbi:hypothetical protein [Mesorhizobium sp. M0496]|uniref:hypothetical protein n=1 Tax=Mesorhizobium sp. M0496 TaxID=2956952 RepID=UPI00333939D9